MEQPERPQDVTRLIQIAFGRRVAAARKAVRPKRTQTQLAQAIGVSRVSVSNLENGKQRIFLDHVYAIARALKTPVTSLMPTEREVEVLGPVQIAGDAAVGEHQTMLDNLAQRVWQQSAGTSTSGISSNGEAL